MSKLILFIIGALVFLMGLLPILSTIPAVLKVLGNFPQAGTLNYQLILILLGAIAMGYALKKEGITREKRR